MTTPDHVELLVEEYRSLLQGAIKGDDGYSSDDADKITTLLVREAKWTPQAAEHLMELANSYGSFMLRNALSPSLSLGIEDGALGF
jgi:hypothetical protein